MAHKSKSKSNRRTSISRQLTNKIKKPKLRVLFKPFKFTEWAIILGVILLGTSGVIYQKHEQKVHQQLNLAPTSSQLSSAPDSSSASTQPLQTTTPSTPATTTPPQSSSTSSAANCTQVVVPSTTTTYQDDSSLPQGQTESMSEGFPGFKLICNGKVTKEIPPTPGLVYVGTGTSSGSSTTEPSQTSTTQGNGVSYSQASADCQSYVQNLATGGTTSGLSSLFASCMHQYGY